MEIKSIFMLVLKPNYKESNSSYIQKNMGRHVLAQHAFLSTHGGYHLVLFCFVLEGLKRCS